MIYKSEVIKNDIAIFIPNNKSGVNSTVGNCFFKNTRKLCPANKESVVIKIVIGIKNHVLRKAFLFSMLFFPNKKENIQVMNKLVVRIIIKTINSICSDIQIGFIKFFI